MSNTPTFRLISQFDDKAITVTDTVVIGRQNNCGFVLPYDSISREHATLGFIDNKPTVVDLGSSNGTFLNGSKITKSELTSGDILAFDQYCFLVELLVDEETRIHVGQDVAAVQPNQTPAAEPEPEIPRNDQKPEEVNENQNSVVEIKQESPAWQSEPVQIKEVPNVAEVGVNNDSVAEPDQEALPEVENDLQPEKESEKPAVSLVKEERPDAERPKEEVSKKVEQSLGNWWETGEVGPRNTVFMDPMKVPYQDSELLSIPDQSFNEPILYGISDAVANTVIELKEGTMMLGRSDVCDYIVDSKHISDKHAQIVYQPPTLKVIGMPNTTNGTFVNGDKVGGGVYLQSGDILSFGPIQYKVLLEASNKKNAKPSGNTISWKYPIIGLIVVSAVVVFVWQWFKTS